MDKAPSIGSLVCLNTASCLRSLRVIAQVRTRVILVGNLVWEFPNLGTDRRTSKVNRKVWGETLLLNPWVVLVVLSGPACDLSLLTKHCPGLSKPDISLWLLLVPDTFWPLRDNKVYSVVGCRDDIGWSSEIMGTVAIVSTRWILWEASNSAQRQSGWRACAGCDGHVESPDDHRTNPAELKVLGPWSVSSLFCEYTNINLGHIFLKSYKSNWILISYTNTAINAAHSLKQSFSKYIKGSQSYSHQDVDDRRGRGGSKLNENGCTGDKQQFADLTFTSLKFRFIVVNDW